MLSVREVAHVCAVSEDAVRRAIRRGDLPAAKVFGRIRVAQGELETYIRAGQVGGGEVARRRPRPVRSEGGSLIAMERRPTG